MSPSLSFISIAKCTLSFIWYDILNPESSLNAKIPFPSLHTLSPGIYTFLFYSPQPWSTRLLFPSQTSLRAANHTALGQKAWGFCVCTAKYLEIGFTLPDTSEFWFWLYFSYRLPEIKSGFTKSPCHLTPSTYLYFAFFQLQFRSHPKRR